MTYQVSCVNTTEFRVLVAISESRRQDKPAHTVNPNIVFVVAVVVVGDDDGRNDAPYNKASDPSNLESAARLCSTRNHDHHNTKRDNNHQKPQPMSRFERASKYRYVLHTHTPLRRVTSRVDVVYTAMSLDKRERRNMGLKTSK